MNQILFINSEKDKKGSLDIKVIIKIFAVLFIIYGVILIGKGSYGMINKEEVTNDIPTVEITQQANKLKLNIKYNKVIDKIIYFWNNQKTEIVLQGKGRNEIQETIDLPVGTNTLHLRITDINGKVSNYSSEYTLAAGDVTDPQIEFQLEGSKVKIVARDETEMDHIEYYWNNEDSTKLQVNPSMPKQIEEKISILKGENTLYVIAVDKAGNEAIKEQTFKGAKKPTISLRQEGKYIVITTTDEEGIQKIEFTLNGTFYSTDPDNSGTSLNMKEAEVKQELVEGTNTITVKVYNINGLEAETTAEPTI